MKKGSKMLALRFLRLWEKEVIGEAVQFEWPKI